MIAEPYFCLVIEVDWGNIQGIHCSVIDIAQVVILIDNMDECLSLVVDDENFSKRLDVLNFADETIRLKLWWTIGSIHPTFDMLEGDNYQDFIWEGGVYDNLCMIFIVFELSENMA